MDQDTALAVRIRSIRPIPLTGGAILWLCFWAAVPAPSNLPLQCLALVCAALCLAAAASAAGLLGQKFRSFSCCLHILLFLSALTALNNAAAAVGMFILICQGAAFGGSWLLKAGLPARRPTHEPR